MKLLYTFSLFFCFSLFAKAQEASSPRNELGLRFDAIRLSILNDNPLEFSQLLYRRHLAGHHFLRFRGLLSRGSRIEQNNTIVNNFQWGGFAGYEYRKNLSEDLSLVLGTEVGQVTNQISRRPRNPMGSPPTPNDNDRVTILNLSFILGVHYSIEDLFFIQIEVLPSYRQTNISNELGLLSRNVSFGLPNNISASVGLQF